MRSFDSTGSWLIVMSLAGRTPIPQHRITGGYRRRQTGAFGPIRSLVVSPTAGIATCLSHWNGVPCWSVTDEQVSPTKTSPGLQLFGHSIRPEGRFGHFDCSPPTHGKAPDRPICMTNDCVSVIPPPLECKDSSTNRHRSAFCRNFRWIARWHPNIKSRLSDGGELTPAEFPARCHRTITMSRRVHRFAAGP